MIQIFIYKMFMFQVIQFIFSASGIMLIQHQIRTRFSNENQNHHQY